MARGGARVGWVLVLVSALAACGAGRTEANHLTLAGSSTIQPVMEVAAQAFEAANPGIEVDVQGGGSSVGVSSARSGLADIGMVSRDLDPGEEDLVPVPIGLDGIAVIVHASNPLAALTRDQLVKVYTGAITDWQGLGVPPHHLTVVTKEHGRSTRELFDKYLATTEPYRDDLVVIGPNGQAIATVAGDPDALAYVSIGSAAVAEANGTTIRRVPLDGVAPTVEAVADGTYPLSRRLNLVTNGQPDGLAAAFLAFVTSPAGQKIVADQDFTPVAR